MHPNFQFLPSYAPAAFFFQRAAGADYTSASSALNWQRFKAHRPRPLDVIDQTEPRANGDDICKRRVCSRRFLVAHLRPEYTTFKENQIKALTQTKKKKGANFFFLAWPSLQTSPDVASVKKKKKGDAQRGGERRSPAEGHVPDVPIAADSAAICDRRAHSRLASVTFRWPPHRHILSQNKKQNKKSTPLICISPN